MEREIWSYPLLPWVFIVAVEGSIDRAFAIAGSRAAVILYQNSVSIAQDGMGWEKMKLYFGRRREKVWGYQHPRPIPWDRVVDVTGLIHSLLGPASRSEDNVRDDTEYELRNDKLATRMRNISSLITINNIYTELIFTNWFMFAGYNARLVWTSINI